jgi:hypothetical protein
MIVFCQLDVTGRTESDPSAEALVENLLRYVEAWTPVPLTKAVYAGDTAARSHFAAAGINLDAYQGGQLSINQVLVLGPGAGRELSASKGIINAWLNQGGHLVAIGIDQSDADALLPFKIGMRSQEHISSFFEPNALGSAFTGIGPADVLDRDPKQLPLLMSGTTVVGDGVLATAKNGNVVFCQVVPWQLDPDKQSNLKRTFRRYAFVVSRLLANQGVSSSTPILERFRTPVSVATPEKRWTHGLYLDQPEEWDDPYRFFRW